ncbi:mediator complex subunit [Dispira parvispora]|uniref:Mediator of RNA polymerase II transcription subunit 14 n=1 Tax=Dispira parvispora TaxID=1520584 RepID=A0A9W8E971_9FUNG|nr:mediator complex subunit [Dispira parvispora]
MANPSSTTSIGEVELPRVEQRVIPLRLLIEKLVQQSYADLVTLNEVVGDKDHTDGRPLLVQYIHHTRKQFLKLLVALRWWKNAPQLQKCYDIIQYLQRQNDQFNQTVNALHGVATGMMHAKVRNYDVLTAVDVLSTGTYQRFPHIIREQYLLPAPLKPPAITSVLTQLGDAIRLRLLFQETLPKAMRRYTIENGRVVFTVPGEFRISLTLYDLQPDTPFHVVDLDLLVHSDGQLVSFIPPRINSHDKLLLMEQAQKSLLPDSTGEPDASTVGDVTGSPLPLVRLYRTLHLVCVSWQLDILYTQALHLLQGRWEHMIRVQRDELNTYLRIEYWPKVTTTTTGSSRPSTTSVTKLVPISSANATEALYCPTESSTETPLSRTANVILINLSPVNDNSPGLASSIDSASAGPTSSDTTKNDAGDDTATLLRTRWCANSLLSAPLVWDSHDLLECATISSSSDVKYSSATLTFAPELDPTCLNIENFLLDVLTFHAERVLDSLRTTLLTFPQFTPTNVLLLSQHTNPQRQPRLRILFSPTVAIDISVHLHTGHLDVEQARDVGIPDLTPTMSCINPRYLQQLQTLLNDKPRSLGHALIEFTTWLELHEIVTTAELLGYRIMKNINPSMNMLNQLASQSSSGARQFVGDIASGTSISPKDQPIVRPTLPPTTPRSVCIAIPHFEHFFLVISGRRSESAPSKTSPSTAAEFLTDLQAFLMDARMMNDTYIAAEITSPLLGTEVLMVRHIVPVNLTPFLHKKVPQDPSAASSHMNLMTSSALESLVRCCSVQIILLHLEASLKKRKSAFSYKAGTEWPSPLFPVSGKVHKESPTVNGGTPFPSTASKPVSRELHLADIPVLAVKHASLMSPTKEMRGKPSSRLFQAVAGDTIYVSLDEATISNDDPKVESSPSAVRSIEDHRALRMSMLLPVKSSWGATLDEAFTGLPFGRPISLDTHGHVTLTFHPQQALLTLSSAQVGNAECLSSILEAWERVAMLLALAHQLHQYLPHQSSYQTSGFSPKLESFDFQTLVLQYTPALQCAITWDTVSFATGGKATDSSPVGRYRLAFAGRPSSPGPGVIESKCCNPHRHTASHLEALLNAQHSLKRLLLVFHETLELLTVLDYVQYRSMANRMDQVSSVDGVPVVPPGMASLANPVGQVRLIAHSATHVTLVGWQQAVLDFIVVAPGRIRFMCGAPPKPLTGNQPLMNGEATSKKRLLSSPLRPGESRPVPVPHLPPSLLATVVSNPNLLATSQNGVKSTSGLASEFGHFPKELMAPGSALSRSGNEQMTDAGYKVAVRNYYQWMLIPSHHQEMTWLHDTLLYTTGLTWYVVQRFYQLTQTSVELHQVEQTLREFPELQDVVRHPSPAHFTFKARGRWFFRLTQQPDVRWRLQLDHPLPADLALGDEQWQWVTQFLSQQLLGSIDRLGNALRALLRILDLPNPTLQDCFRIMALSGGPSDGALKLTPIWHMVVPDGAPDFMPPRGASAVVIKDHGVGLLFEYRDPQQPERHVFVPLWHNFGSLATQVWERESAEALNEKKDLSMSTKSLLDLVKLKNQNKSKPARLLADRVYQCTTPCKLWWSVQELAKLEAASTSVYLRIKRQRQTLFVLAQPQTTMQELKTQVREALGPDVVQEDGGNLRLGHEVTTASTKGKASDTAQSTPQQVKWFDNDKDTVAGLKLNAGDILFAVLKDQSGTWEPVDIPVPPPLEGDEDPDHPMDE